MIKIHEMASKIRNNKEWELRRRRKKNEGLRVEAKAVKEMINGNDNVCVQNRQLGNNLYRK